MTAITERVPMAEISRQAHQVRFTAVLVAVITGVLFGLGWLVAKVFAVLWLALAWQFTAARLGWQHAQLRAATPKLTLAEQASLLTEVQTLRTENERLHGRG